MYNYFEEDNYESDYQGGQRKAATGELLDIYIEDYCSLSVARDRVFG